MGQEGILAGVPAEIADSATQIARANPPATAAMGIWPERYGMLDGWRGIAALLVVLHHVSPIRVGGEAVMAFFVISGYCILASAESCRAKGLKFRQFMWRRIHRIYPPYLCSLALFLITRWVKGSFTSAQLPHVPWHVWLQNLTLTQWLTLLRHPMASPDGNPSSFVTAYWSLNYEEQFYLLVGMLMGVGLLWGRRRTIISALMAVGVAWFFVFPNSFHGIFIEFWPQFGVGAVVFYRLCRTRGAAEARTIDISLATLVVLSIGYDLLVRFGKAPAIYAVYQFSIAAAFALLLIGLRRWDAAFKASALGRVLAGLGAISYSLYLIHQFNLRLVSALEARLLPFAHASWIRILAQLCLHLLIATAFWSICERPFLNRRPKPATAPGTMPALAAQ